MWRIEDTIKKETNKACRELNLEPIEVKFNSDGVIAFARHRDDYGNIHITIGVYELMNTTKINNNDYTCTKYKLNSVSKRIRFIIYHEVAHYLQNSKYRKWFNKTQENYRYSGISEADYRKQPSEHKADRIALCLINKGV